MTDEVLRGGRIVALCGGIGGAKLAFGLAHLLGERLTLVVNTGDDFRHFGLYIAPDLDTVMYTLAGVVDPARGWGRATETWQAMETLKRLGAETWFQLGDLDLGVHLERTRRLAAGDTLSAVTADFCTRFGLATAVLPMTDDPVHTLVESDEGCLSFQDYFVRRQCRPVVRAIRFEGAEDAGLPGGVRRALAASSLAAIVLCPSNPYLSIDPILAVPGLRRSLREAAVPVIALAPLIGGRAVKGPTAKIMNELGLPPDVVTIAAHYGDFLNGMVIDPEDRQMREALLDLGMEVHIVPTLMRTRRDRLALARHVLNFVERLSR